MSTEQASPNLLLPYAFARRHGVLLELTEANQAFVYYVQTPQLQILAELKRRVNSRLELKQLSQPLFDQRLRDTYEHKNSETSTLMEDLGGDFDLERLAHEVPQTTDLLDAEDNAPIIRLTNALLTQAIRENVSDIHLEAFEDESIVRYRVDGLLKQTLTLRRELHNALISRIKVMSKLDIAERRLPQDGRMSLKVAEHPIDVRVSILPAQHGERVVLRLLDKQSNRLDLSSLGMPDQILSIFKQLIDKPNGIFLVTGPTGSGKTTTLYAGLNQLNRQQLNILTVEDPIEYDLVNVGQTQINSKIGLTFSSGLRSILRQDPDVVLVGEIRDLETAQVSVQASLTGHLVLSTLHTNTAIGAITRLIDMGVEPFLIASSLVGVLAQRLVRKLCTECKTPFKPNKAQLASIKLNKVPANTLFHQPKGCNKCNQTGYQGRIGIYELIVIDEALRPKIHDQVSEGELADHVRKSSPSLFANGLERVFNGETSIEEILRVTQA